MGGGVNIRPRDQHIVAVFTYGRFQPPHAGHASLVTAVDTTAKRLGGDGYVFPTSSLNEPKYLAGQKHAAMVTTGRYETCKGNENPLTIEQKIYFLEKMNPSPSIRFINTTICECKTISSVVEKLREAGYTQIVMLVGDDRVEDFQRLFNKETDMIIQGAGDKRNLKSAMSGAIKNISGSKVRAAAVSADIEKFRQATQIGAMTLRDVYNLMNIVRAGLCFRPIDPVTEDHT
jgi:nicotinic acid mononucleotide adenylyltransferase